MVFFILWLYGCLDGFEEVYRMNGRMDVRMYGWMHESIIAGMSCRINVKMDVRMFGRIYCRIFRRTDVTIYGMNNCNIQKSESFYMIFYTPFERSRRYLRYLLFLTSIRHIFAGKNSKNMENKKKFDFLGTFIEKFRRNIPANHSQSVKKYFSS